MPIHVEFNKKELSNIRIVYLRNQESWLKTWKFLIPQRGQDLSCAPMEKDLSCFRIH